MSIGREVQRIVDQITPILKPLLAGHPQEVQGAVVADLVAIHLASHIVPGSKRQTRELREALLALHISTVRQLTEINSMRIHGE